MTDKHVNQQVQGNHNIIGGTGDIHIHNYPPPSGGQDDNSPPHVSNDVEEDTPPKNEPKLCGWRWYSTVESAANLEFSILAAVESVCAVSLALWLAWYFQTYTHLVVAVLVAPLLLLRTEESTELGLRWFGMFQHWFINDIRKETLSKLLWLGIALAIIGIPILSEYIFRTIESSVFIKALLIGVWLFMSVLFYVGGIIVIMSLVIKFFATVINIFTHSKNTFLSIPYNWYRIVCTVDILHPPEILPGIESSKYYKPIDGLDQFRYNKWMHVYDDEYIKEQLYLEHNIRFKTLPAWIKYTYKNNNRPGLSDIPQHIIGMIVYVPALFYRWSLKSTALFYLPFIWIIGIPKNLKTITERFDEALDKLKNGAWAQVQILYAGIVLLLFTALPLILEAQFNDLLTQTPDNLKILVNGIVPFFFMTEIHAWHIARFLAAVLTLVLWWYASDQIISRKYRSDAGSPQLVLSLQRARALLSLFTLGSAAYVLYQAIDWHSKFAHFQWWPGG